MSQIKYDDTAARARILQNLPMLDKVQASDIRSLILDVWQEAWRKSDWNDITDCPSNPKLAGLPIIRQANSVAEMALAVASIMSSAYDEFSFDTDLLIAGGLLLDASKIVEMEPNGDAGGARFSKLTKVMPHAIYAAHMALSNNASDDIVNVILSHTKHVGATPISVEAVVLHYVDYMVADCMRFGERRIETQCGGQ